MSTAARHEAVTRWRNKVEREHGHGRQAGKRRLMTYAADPDGVRPAVLRPPRRDGRPLRNRRAQLEDVVAGSELVFPVRRLAPDGVEAWRQVVEHGYEGYVAKDEASPYEGGPTRRWLKVSRRAGRSRRTAGSGGSAR